MSCNRVIYDAYTAVTARYAGTGATLYGKGEAVAVIRSAGANTRGGTAYLGKDVLGSVMTATNEYGALEERYEYDAFGKPYKGDFSNGVNLGYTGKPYDTVTGLYNYGYRDYQPETARFTTVDPVRDGANWFAYVNNDPVNYTDPLGLQCVSASDKGIYTNSSTLSTVVPIDGPITGSPPVVGFFSATVTTTVVTTPNSNKADVFSYTTLGPTYYNATATTTATVTVNGSVYDSKALTPQSAILSADHVSLGGTTLNIPSSGKTTVTTVTTWSIPSVAGIWSPGSQTVSVPIK
jgi:RHS repeat-associated protein